ncbi:MAG: hypothetical protein PHE18_00440 [Candidatus Omnitrophica bacterium]|nr:hypothetical protein [Candidatus Omnitrophota bacterium]MDD5552332.1 hypothetical protein [Candidatus Omnitrophota bacterium]
MRLSGHVICTLTVSGLVYFFLKSAAAFFVSLAAGIFIDIDHVFDYYVQRGITLNPADIYSWCNDIKYDLIILLFHSLELLFLLWAAVFLFDLGIIWFSLAIGLTQHMALDVLSNRKKIGVTGYFLLFRMAKGFKKEGIMRDSALLENGRFS